MINSLGSEVNSSLVQAQNEQNVPNSLKEMAEQIFEQFLNSQLSNVYQSTPNRNFIEEPVQEKTKEVFFKNFGTKIDTTSDVETYLKNLAMVKRMEFLNNQFSEDDVNDLKNELSLEALVKNFEKFPLPESFPEDFQVVRMGGSSTITGSGEAEQARDNWLEADKYVRNLAKSHKNGGKLELKDILKINEILGKGLKNNEGKAGELRTFEVAAGGTKDYLPQKMVEKCMKSFVKWLDKEIENIKIVQKEINSLSEEERGNLSTEEQESLNEKYVQANPITLAAKAYQRLVSIHPFPDANGRTTRMVMDYILMRHGICPSVLNDTDAAVFTLQEHNEVTPRILIGKVYNGVIKGMCDYELYPE